MRSFLFVCTFATVGVAQTTGVPGINDLTVNGFGSGQTSCATTCFANGNLVLNYTVSAPFGAPVLIAFNLCPCAPCTLPGPANFCAPPIPLTACALSNQSFDLSLNAACGPLTLLPTTPILGTTLSSLSIAVPPIPGAPCLNLALSAQAVIIDPCGAGLFAAPGPFVLSQAITTWF